MRFDAAGLQELRAVSKKHSRDSPFRRPKAHQTGPKTKPAACSPRAKQAEMAWKQLMLLAVSLPLRLFEAEQTRFCFGWRLHACLCSRRDPKLRFQLGLGGDWFSLLLPLLHPAMRHLRR